MVESYLHFLIRLHGVVHNEFRETNSPIIHSSMALHPTVGPWPIFFCFVALYRRLDYLDGKSAGRKTALLIATQQVHWRADG
jgi:hypothetical protein